MNIGAPEEQLALPRRTKRISWSLFKIALVSICFVAVFGYVIFYYLIPRSVAAVQIRLAAVPLEIAGPALLDARNKVTVTARIQGYLKSVKVDRNDPVKAGEVLAELDSADLASQLEAATADAKAAESGISEARSDQLRARALADRAKQDYDRKVILHEKNIITEADYSTAEATFHQTQADLARAGTTIAKAIAQSSSANANVGLLGVRLSYATITSPLNGVVVSRERNVGDLLSPGTPLLQLVDPDSIILTARLDESAMGAIEAGQTATISFASMPTQNFNGKVLRVIRQVDQETREFAVDITLDRLPNHWALGQRANVVIQAPSPTPTITISQSLISPRDGRVGVWRLRGNSAEWTPIDLGYPSGDKVQVVNGLNAGDVVLEPEGSYAHMPVTARETQQ